MLTHKLLAESLFNPPFLTVTRVNRINTSFADTPKRLCMASKRISRPVAGLLATALAAPLPALPAASLAQLETIRQRWAGVAAGKRYSVLLNCSPQDLPALVLAIVGAVTLPRVHRVHPDQVLTPDPLQAIKNIDQLFMAAENQQWILLFDEADTLFGKRSDVQDAHDRYASSSTGYLLQRIAQFAGPVILASPGPGLPDDLWVRRFDAVIRFPIPAR